MTNERTHCPRAERTHRACHPVQGRVAVRRRGTKPGIPHEARALLAGRRYVVPGPKEHEMSRGASKSYTRQFREQAMDLVRVQGLDPTHAARELGMPFSTLPLWLRKAGWVRRAAGPA